jgi:anti-sigma regulatory factor (Ser/Thr protein kinase)
VLSTGLAAETNSAGQARHFVANALDGWGCAHVADTACLLASELVTNAIRHGHSGSR